MSGPRLRTLQVELGFLTPAFLAGADQNGAPELRAPSMRGALRHWLRAIDPAWRHRERLLFGDTQRQGAVLLQIEPQPPRTPWSWTDNRSVIERVFQVGQGKEAKNGLKYLGYTLALRGNEGRRAFPADTAFKVRFTLPDRTALLPARLRDDPGASRDLRLGDPDVFALLGAIWALATLGALGTRARRGFGSLQLRRWAWDPAAPVVWADALGQLPLIGPTVDLANVVERVEVGRSVLRSWLNWPTGDVPHLGQKARVVVLPTRAPPNVPRDLEWATPLQAAGLALQRYRSGREPDRQLAREHVRFMLKRGGGALVRTPERAAFGLPLTFRFLAQPARDLAAGQFEVNPSRRESHTYKPAQRWPSPLRIKAIQTRQGRAALLVRMDGTLPIDEPTLVRGADKPLERQPRNLLDDFMNELAPPGRRP